MQQKSDQKSDYSDFSDRTDAVAERLNVRIADLASRLKMSTDMLMGYRTGRYPISKKAWRKLEAAENAIAITDDGDALVDGRIPVDAYLDRSSSRMWRNLFQEIVRDFRAKAVFYNEEADKIEAKLKREKVEDDLLNILPDIPKKPLKKQT